MEHYFTNTIICFLQKLPYCSTPFNQRLDWSVVNLAPTSRPLTLHQSLSCSICDFFSETPWLGEMNGGCKSKFKFCSLCIKCNVISLFYSGKLESSLAIGLYRYAALSVSMFFSITSGSEELSSLPPHSSSTSLMKMYPTVKACTLWGKHWSRKLILFFSSREYPQQRTMLSVNTFVRRLLWPSEKLIFQAWITK